MSKAAARVVMRLLRTQNGVIGGLPRIVNIDRNVSFYGYAEVNTQATSPVARIKQHKAWFEPSANIVEGDLIQDRADDKYYLVMSLKKEVTGGVCTYIDGTLYWTNATCSIQRFPTGATTGTKDAFGRLIEAGPVTVASGVYIMTNSMSLGVNEQEDQVLSEEKIKVVMQAKFAPQRNDRLVSSLGDTYKVISVDRTQLNGLWVLYVDQDIR